MDYLITRDDGSRYLVHHGIKGQKWGVRRFQNEDGTLTEEGKIRYRSQFTSTRERVISESTNFARPIVKQSINISEVQKRSGLSTQKAKECAKLADKLFNTAARNEPQITSDVISAVSKSGGKMHGLSNRLKQPTSIAGKIGSDAKEKSITLNEAASAINDTIRYTSISNESNFVKAYNDVKKSLESKGYEETKCKNYFISYANGQSMHKAVQCVYKNQNGQNFEIQFQTPSSQAAKELKVPIYEERRQSGISNERASELEKKMRRLAEQVPDIPDIEKIKSH